MATPNSRLPLIGYSSAKYSTWKRPQNSTLVLEFWKFYFITEIPISMFIAFASDIHLSLT